MLQGHLKGPSGSGRGPTFAPGVADRVIAARIAAGMMRAMEPSRLTGELAGPLAAQASRATAPAGRAAPRGRSTRSLARAVRHRAGALALAPVYRLYAHRLRDQVMSRPRPGHVAIIMDGNRRWAQREGLADPGAGHRRGADKILEVLGWCSTLGIDEVTLWALSMENLDRSPEELAALLDVVTERLAGLAGRKGRPAPMRVRVIGRRDALPDQVRAAIEAAEAATSTSRGPLATFAVAYSGHDELVDACRETVRDLVADGVPADQLAAMIDETQLARHLYTTGRPDPELIIRTSGEVRLSGFLPWQSAHSEFYFCDAYWPAFREIDFLRALRTFQLRARRFGR
jgi:short-chain Z-isoprenyl diphosphate synthase